MGYAPRQSSDKFAALVTIAAACRQAVIAQKGLSGDCKSTVMHEIAGQVHWHEPSGFKRAGFGKFGRPKTPYDLFMESEGIPVFRDIGVTKVQNLPLAPWKRLGGRGRCGAPSR